MTVKAWLQGHTFDLEVLAELFPAGDVRVAKEGDEYYLTAIEMSASPTGREFYEVAPEALRRVNGLARAMHPNDYRPVELADRYEGGDGRHHVVQADGAETREQALPVTVVRPNAIDVRSRVGAASIVVGAGEPVPQPLPGPRYLALVAQHPDAAEALAIMGVTEPNWVDLYKVFEIIRRNIQPATIESNDWATKRQQGVFTGSANHPGVSGVDARHARLREAPPAHTMSLQEGRQFIGDLVVLWIDTLQPER